MFDCVFVCLFFFFFSLPIVWLPSIDEFDAVSPLSCWQIFSVRLSDIHIQSHIKTVRLNTQIDFSVSFRFQLPYVLSFSFLGNIFLSLSLSRSCSFLAHGIIMPRLLEYSTYLLDRYAA